MWTLLQWVGPDHLTKMERQRGLQCVRKAQPQFKCMAVDVLQVEAIHYSLKSVLAFSQGQHCIYPVYGIDTYNCRTNQTLKILILA